MIGRILPRYLSAMRSYRFRLDELHALQDRKLRRAIGHAFSYVPHYRRLFRKMGLTPEDFKSTQDLRRLPILTRQDLAANYPDGLMSKGMKPSLVRITTGTTGQSAKVAFTDEFMEVKAALMFRRFVNFGIRPWHRIVTIWDPAWRWRRLEGEGGPKRTTQLREIPFATFLGSPIPQIKVIAAGLDTTAEEAMELYASKPDFIFCRPTHLRRIGVSLREQGLEVKAKGLICTNEVLTNTCAEELQGMFKARALRLFGGSEGGPLGEDCKFRTGVHLNEDHYILEVLRDGEPAAPGETGEVVLTHLHNPVMPLIRYAMGDLVEVGDGGTCECGSSLPRLRSIQGRVKDRLVAHDGSRLDPLGVADHIESVIGLRDFQIVQTGSTKFVVRTWGGTAGTSVLLRIQDYIGGLVGTEVAVTTEARGWKEQWAKERPIVCAIG